MKISKSGSQISRIEFKESIFPFTFLETKNGILVGGYKYDITDTNPKSYLTFIQNQKIIWEKTYSNRLSSIKSIVEVNDGGYLLTGYIKSTNGYNDILVIRIDELGNPIWEKNFGGDLEDNVSIIVKHSNGFLIGGTSESDISGNKTSKNKGNYDIWIIKIDISGNLLWEKSLGGNSGDFLSSLFVDSDESILVGGNSYSGVSGDKSDISKGMNDYWVLKLNSNGVKLWDKSFGGSGSEIPKGVTKIQNNEYLIFGNSSSVISGDKSEERYNKDFSDYWLVGIDSNGNKLWDKTIGGRYDEDINNVFYDSNSTEFTIGGLSDSPISFDKTTGSTINNRFRDCWIVN